MRRIMFPCRSKAGARLVAAALYLGAAALASAQSATPPPDFWSRNRPATPGVRATPAPLSTATAASSLSALQGATGGIPPGGAPARDVPLIEKKASELSNQTYSADGKKALEINPDKWKHAETDNFILHYRRVTEAQKVAREVEYDLWYVATFLGANKDRYKKKSHVYIFEDEDEWKTFLQVSDNPMKWAASYAWGDELYLNVRGGGNSGPGTSFDSHTLAHETTHAVVARLYPGERWPLWLNEGFAEYMGGASVAARKGQYMKRYERMLANAEMPLSRLEEMKTYPETPTEISQLYQTSEKFVRFLLTEAPKERFPKFIDSVISGHGMQQAVLQVYNDKFKDWDALEKQYQRFNK